ncbi:MAG: hypothetical protein Q9191_002555 [Dirinaria sp. TL-2023a]
MSNYLPPSSPHLGPSFMHNVQYPHHPFSMPSGNTQYNYPPSHNVIPQGHLPLSNVQGPGQHTNVYSFDANRQDSNPPSAATSATKVPLPLGHLSSSNATRQPHGSASVSNTTPASFSRSDSLQRQFSGKGVVTERTPNKLASQIHNSTIQLHEPIGKTPDQPALDPAAMSDLEDGELSDRGSVSEEAKLETERKRVIAKDALHQLYENKIGFLEVLPDIVLEGSSPSFLKQLYSEIGISISSSDMAVASALQARLGRNGSGNEIGAQQIGRRLENLNTSSAPATTEQATEHSSRSDVDHNTALLSPKNDGASESRVTHSTETKSTKAPAQTVKPLPASNAASRNQVITPASIAAIPKSAKSGEKSFDRKDYIARMLAAKSNKSQSHVEGTSLASPSPKSSLNTIPPSADDSLATSKTAQPRNESTVVERPPDPKVVLQRSPITEPRVNKVKTNASDNVYGSHNTGTIRPELERTDAEAKKKAQTELARQKMEALKNREHLQRKDLKLQNSQIAVTVQPPTSSFPQTAAAQASHSSVPANAKEHIPAPQPSYFFPISGKEPFNLPGLFISNGQLIDETPPQPFIALGAQAQPAVQSLSGVAGSRSHSPSDSSMQEVRRSPVPILGVTSKPTLVEETLEVNAGNRQLTNSARKRHKAADFLDPPSTRIKRHLGSSKDVGVVIEVSDDEAFDGPEGDDMRMEIDTEHDVSGDTRERSVINSVSSQQKDRRLERQGSDSLKHIANLTMTPPLAHTSGKVASLDGLNSMEKKIELMNRKIAELEQRRRAKQSSSRAQTPTAVGAKSISPNLGQVVPDTSEKDQSTQVYEEQPSRITEPSINDEANISTAEAMAATEPDRSSEEASLKHVEQERETAIATGRLEQAEGKRLQDLEARQLAEIEQNRAQELEDRQAREIEQRATQIEEERLRDLEQQRNESMELARLSAERQQAVEAQVMAQRQQDLERKAAIEAGLPILDAEVDKTQQKLHLLKQQVRELELELERGIEGRRNLLEELQSLEATVLVSVNIERGHRQGDINEGEITKSNTEGSPSATSQRTDDDAKSSTLGQHETSPAQRRPDLETVSTSISDPPVDGEVAEDTMDISQSDIDEGEIPDCSHRALDTREPETKSLEHEDLYEPPPVIDERAQSSLASREGSRQSELSGTPAVYDHAKSLITTGEASPSLNEYDKADQIPDLSRDQSPSNDMSTGSEDYEPPEPVSPKESWSVSSREQAVKPKPTESIHVPPGNAQTTGPSQQTSSGLQRSIDNQAMGDQPSIQKPLADFEPKASHFTPYESPLKHFRSYRYHPEYAHNVVDGFRSLTYSHDIDAEKPMCPYELLGTCNDDSCRYQHLRSIKLSDDKILVQLGAAPAGLSHEQDAYSRGLREVIRDIRARHIRDFNTVAAEIIAYRARFLGDKTKILPL